METPITLFPNVSARTKEDAIWSMDLLDPDLAFAGKLECPLVKFARFGDERSPAGSLRHDGNVVCITGVEADYDGGEVPLATVAAKLKAVGITAILYTSASHTAEDPRYRVLLPFTEAYYGPPAELQARRALALDKAQAIMGIEFDRSSYTLSQTFFVGQVRHAEDYETWSNDGECIDEILDWSQMVVREDAVELPAAAGGEDVEEARYFLSFIPVFSDHSAWVKIGMALQAGLGDDGLALWDEWSKEGSNYDPHECAKRWPSFAPKPGGVTFDHIKRTAREHGGDPARCSIDLTHGLIIDERLNDSPMVQVLMQHPTEDSVAMAFSERHKGQYYYLHGAGWHRWDERRWQPDQAGSVYQAIRDLARTYNSEGKAAPAKASFVKGVAEHLKYDPAFARNLEEFDADNYMLNCPDALYDLRTGERMLHQPLSQITKITAVRPTGAGGTVFHRFMREVTGNDEGLERFLQVALGACLSGAVEEHWLMCWTGNGRNGKNTLGEIVQYVMGDYAKTIPSNTLMSRTHEGHPTELMNLKGLRLVTSGEIDSNARWAESKIKELTGDKDISARYVHKDLVTFPRTHKHLIYGNYRPQLNNTDVGIKSRLKLVPFNVCFAGREDADLPHKLRVEAGYVLGWLMEGHRLWITQGKKIGTCDAIEAETVDYYDAQSTIDVWIKERCIVERPDGQANTYWTQSKVLFQDYLEWKDERHEFPLGHQRFGETLSKQFPKVKSAGTRYVGLRLPTALDRK
jgi:putative DNA primase/helicase